MFKLTIEILEQGVKYVQSYSEGHKNSVIDVVLVFSLLVLNIFQNMFLYCFYCLLIVYFDQVNAVWVDDCGFFHIY